MKNLYTLGLLATMLTLGSAAMAYPTRVSSPSRTPSPLPTAAPPAPRT